MACFCTSFHQFYDHTFYAELVPGVQQGHFFRVVNPNPNFLEEIKTNLRELENKPQVVFMNRREFTDWENNDDHIYEVIVVLAQPDH